MNSSKKIDRMNELAKRARTMGLTHDEEFEQHSLRDEYLSSLRTSFKKQLQAVKVVDENGSDVTPHSLKKRRRSY
ncbi:hypothetical protein JCM19037_164 [Geomicrobium sp. JCM 19037]|uniref:DUF896 domain-containing protein n=1 Tax=unclassified Geomicrobium TaxID=2628951 RepID=UPI00045F15F3|nr:DUF896 domain-containing protein [Geomicrobium sp. JCM 19037]GAK01966.1 hypothetical protein JCM19037_164 [Geomicrobium sp. JCM 19037]